MSRVLQAKIEAALSPIVRAWQEKGKGFQVDGRPLCTHWIWADNIYIIAKDDEELKPMILDASGAIAAWGFQWKPSSLECLSIPAQRLGKVTARREISMRWNSVVPDIFPATEPPAALPHRAPISEDTAGVVEQVVAPAHVVIHREDDEVPADQRTADTLHFTRKTSMKVLGSWIDVKAHAILSL